MNLQRMGKLVLTGMFLVLVLNFSLYGYITANYTENAFDEGNEDEAVTPPQVMTANASSLKALIANGAAYFLRSHARYLDFLNEIELSDIQDMNIGEMIADLLGARMEIIHANARYSDLVEKANQTPYRYETLIKLFFFDYYNFQAKRNLNPRVFREVINYLSYGDIRGVYSALYRRTSKILADLEKIAPAVMEGTLPDMRQMWSLNQYYAETLLFGQYVAEVFGEVLGK